MSSLSISNCRRCNKPFRLMSRDICPECVELEDLQMKVIYKLLRESEPEGGMSVDDLGKEVGMTPDEVIELVSTIGGLGTMVSLIKIPCPSCGEVVGGTDRQGRFCKHCAAKIAEEGKLEIKSQQAIEAASARKDLLSQLKQKAKPSTEPIKRAFHSQRGS